MSDHSGSTHHYGSRQLSGAGTDPPNPSMNEGPTHQVCEVAQRGLKCPPAPASISPRGRVVLCLHRHERRVCVTSFLSAHMPPRMPFCIDSHWAEMAGGGAPQPLQRRGGASYLPRNEITAGSQIWLFHLPAVQSWPSHLTTLSLCFLLWNMGTMLSPSQGCCGD